VTLGHIAARRSGKDGAMAETTCAPLDPEVAAALEALPIDIGALLGGLTDASIAETRAAMGQMPVPELTDAVERTDHEVPGTDGVVVRVHRPVGATGELPCLYWMHGGGLVLGSYAGDDPRFDRWSPMFGLVGVSVEYRLAPESPYPGPLEDCYAGLRWVHEHAGELGVDPARIGVGGPSAGGNLAAGLALLARDRGEVPLQYQLLIYPMLDDRQITASSTWPDPIWPPSANTYGWTAYLGAAKGGPDVPAYAAPARATDLAGLPPTLIAVGAIDGFSDEDIEYAVRLRQAGVTVDLHVYAGAPHGFEGLAPASRVAQRANRDIEEWLGAQLSRATAAG
jgi:acetyl esterase/lipase